MEINRNEKGRSLIALEIIHISLCKSTFLNADDQEIGRILKKSERN